MSLLTYKLLLLDCYIHQQTQSIKKSIAHMQAHFSSLGGGSTTKIFPKFPQVSLLES